MTFNTAQQIIDKELQNKDKYTGFEIDLFGESRSYSLN